MNGFGVDEQLVHSLGYICHKDETFLAPSVQGPKRAGRIVTRTKGWRTKRQGTLSMYVHKETVKPNKKYSKPYVFIFQKIWHSTYFSSNLPFKIVALYTVHNMQKTVWVLFKSKYLVHCAPADLAMIIHSLLKSIALGSLPGDLFLSRSTRISLQSPHC